MQLFVRSQQSHTLQVTGQETVADLKVINITYDNYSKWLHIRASEPCTSVL